METEGKGSVGDGRVRPGLITQFVVLRRLMRRLCGDLRDESVLGYVEAADFTDSRPVGLPALHDYV